MLGDDWADHSPVELASRYDHWLRVISELAIWSPDNSSSGRIHWRSFQEAQKSPIKKVEFDSAGCYLWACGSGLKTVIPRYVGGAGVRARSKNYSLRSRFRQRYVPGKNKQCPLAASYAKELIEGGWKNLPDHILAWYLEFQYGRRFNREGWGQLDEAAQASILRSSIGRAVRLQQAEDFARHGIEDMWFALIPVVDRSKANQLEKKLIQVAQQWNMRNGRPSLLNKQGLKALPGKP